jgi:hypothetical protein
MLHDGRWRLRFVMRSLDFSLYSYSRTVALGRHSLYQKWEPGIFLRRRGAAGECVKHVAASTLTTLWASTAFYTDSRCSVAVSWDGDRVASTGAVSQSQPPQPRMRHATRRAATHFFPRGGGERERERVVCGREGECHSRSSTAQCTVGSRLDTEGWGPV